MKATGFHILGAQDRTDALQDITLPRPTPQGSDLPVAVRAVSVNPGDTKVRRSVTPEPGQWTVLGRDAVVEAGPEVTGFRPGDQVYYAGSITRPGANAECHLVDERIVGC